jgi:antitoxin (DNA-binding transcriptional repressor) of toxin-antitoxin stability system
MQMTMAVEEIKITLLELLERLSPGDEVILTQNHQPVAKLVSEAPKPVLIKRPGPGLGREMIAFIAPDFDAPLEYLKDYMK